MIRAIKRGVGPTGRHQLQQLLWRSKASTRRLPPLCAHALSLQIPGGLRCDRTIDNCRSTNWIGGRLVCTGGHQGVGLANTAPSTAVDNRCQRHCECMSKQLPPIRPCALILTDCVPHNRQHRRTANPTSATLVLTPLCTASLCHHASPHFLTLSLPRQPHPGPWWPLLHSPYRRPLSEQAASSWGPPPTKQRCHAIDCEPQWADDDDDRHTPLLWLYLLCGGCRMERPAPLCRQHAWSTVRPCRCINCRQN